MNFFKPHIFKTLKSFRQHQKFIIRHYVQVFDLDHKFKEFEVKNEPVRAYAKGSKEREELDEEIQKLSNTETCIPIVIGDQEITTRDYGYQLVPHCHSHKLAKYYKADSKTIQRAICAALDKQVEWDRMPVSDRIDIFLKAADLLAGKYRTQLVAATMLGQSKTPYEAEIDAGCELPDFMRFHAYFLNDILKYRPISIEGVTRNSNRLRGLDGFVAAISPFNFTAIAGNLAYTPALCGNTVLWKPSHQAVLSNYIIFRAMTEAGVPPGVVNFIPSEGSLFGDRTTACACLGAINFTGSNEVFRHLWGQVGKNITKFNTFPRLLGECGGKNFHFVHPSANMCNVLAATIKSAFEYSGQKCSACSRLYVPECMWSELKSELIRETNSLITGDVQDPNTFTGAVVDKLAYDKIVKAIQSAKINKKMEIIAGGDYNDHVGYFVCPTVIETKDPLDRLMKEEIFGPVLMVYVYKDSEVKKTLELVRTTVPYALTGSIFAEDEKFICEALFELKYAAGNMYLNSKSTGAVVGQQPFGGGKLSGTNDKPGGPHYVLRFLSMQALKQDLILDTKLHRPEEKRKC